MIAVGLALLWVSYTLILYGWTKFHQMPVSLMDLTIPGRYDACKWTTDVEQGKTNKSTGCIESGTGTQGNTAGIDFIGAGKGTAGGMAQVATSQLGTKDNGGFCQKYGAWYGMNCVPWCDIFVAWCANQNGTLKEVGKFALTTAHAAWFRSQGLWHNGAGGAQPGDIMFFSHGGPGNFGGIYHVGIVIKPTDSSGVAYTIAGDTGAHDVARETWSPGQVAGYGRPNYPGGNPNAPTGPKVVLA